MTGVTSEVDQACPWIEKWLSAERFEPYRDVCSGDADRALELYKWNASLAQVLMRDISFFEVALRNAYEAVMGSCWDGDDHWLLDDSSPVRKPIVRKSARGETDVNRVNRKIIDKAAAMLPRGFSSGMLVSGLTLGFWVHLTDRSREAVIWRTCLYRAWPKGMRRPELQNRLEGILRVRNRCAHGERLFNPAREQLSPKKADADAIALFRDLCPEAAEYMYGKASQTPVELFCLKHPAPVEVRL